LHRVALAAVFFPATRLLSPAPNLLPLTSTRARPNGISYAAVPESNPPWERGITRDVAEDSDYFSPEGSDGGDSPDGILAQECSAFTDERSFSASTEPLEKQAPSKKHTNAVV